MSSTLILGYGNIDRQDDGVAWHVMARLAQRLGCATPSILEGELISSEQEPDFLFVLQLVPELAETLSLYRRVCFLDAHTGNIPEEVQVTNLSGEYQSSPFTHHLTPSSCLALSQTIYQHQPEAILVSIRGYEFGFSRSLSQRTSFLADQAVDHILSWLKPALNTNGLETFIEAG